MANVEPEVEATPKKKGMLIPLLIGLVLAGGGGAGGYWAVTSGPLSGGDSSASSSGHGSGQGDEEAEVEVTHIRPDLEDVAFVALEPLVISIGSETHGRHLLFSAELEVAPDDAEDVEHLLPRVLDVLNSYLRVIDMNELNDPRTLVRLRAQLLRRIQIVTGDVLVRDLLVTGFVVN